MMSKAKKKIVVCGYYGQGNAGDEALLLSLLQFLGDDIEVTVLSGNPLQTSQQYQVKAISRTHLLKIIQALQSADAFLWGGGSLMQDVTSITSPLYYAGLMALAQILQVKTIAWAQGIGPLKRPFIQQLTYQVLKRCQAISVRDIASLQLVENWHLPVTLAPDPVWALQSQLPNITLELPSPYTAVVLRPHPLLTEEVLKRLVEGLKRFQRATNSSLLVIPFQPSQDGEIARFLGEQLGNCSQLLTFENPKQLKGIFSQVTMTIGMRLHGVIMALAEGSSAFALCYDPKVTQLMQSMGLEGWDLGNIPDDVEEIAHSWTQYYYGGKRLSKQERETMVDRTLIHQQLLQQYLA